MAVENHAPLLRTMANVVQALADEAKTQQARADDALGNLRRAALTLDTAARECQALPKKVRQELATEIETALNGAASEAASLLANKFTAADNHAMLAAQRYEKAARILGWRLMGVISIFGVAIIGAATYVIRDSFPATAEIEALRTERDQLQSAVSLLEKSGGKIIFRCSDEKNREHWCARVIDPARDKAVNYKLAGY